MQKFAEFAWKASWIVRGPCFIVGCSFALIGVGIMFVASPNFLNSIK